MADKIYRTVVGIIQFDPKEGEAAGKPVRNIVVREAGFKEQSVLVYATVWPSHKDVELARGDGVILEGTYNQGSGTNQETGEKRVYHNLSVTRLVLLGASIEGAKPDVENTSDEPVDDDDIPF